MMSSRQLIAVACIVGLAGATHAEAQPAAAQGKAVPAPGTKAPVRSLEQSKNVFTCKPMVLGQGVTQSDGGMLEVFQGWIDKAEISAGTDSTNITVKCNYGIDKAFPSQRPAHRVLYTLKGYKLSQCSTSAGNVWCKP